ncbi:methylated-DNA--[protein]-cysteine S-methyltransferase [Actinomyces respiraculi]|uniref:methylated-DNA--[protein]-cysteine S-methyltransferase n=1 Tax=Actinomyces respiraculi TaxID=2744574 RepID=UPI001F1B067C|nr:methylated-DNA--[protein]-cysteine S-methyltransferase [Actinomyces respiraculi]
MPRTVTIAYDSPLGPMTLAAQEGAGREGAGALVGCWFDGQRHDRAGLDEDAAVGTPDELPVLAEATAWLDAYFARRTPGPLPALAPRGTHFQRLVWDALLDIPAGQTRTYGELARDLEDRTGRPRSARAVGGAVGRNPVSIIVPCHRVLGAGGSLTGYAGGTERKTWLLRLEGLPGVAGAGATGRVGGTSASPSQ